jgi:peptide/nickel transport system permease protein
MTTYIIRRVLLLIPTLLISSILVFVIIRLIPGSAVDILISRMDLSAGSSVEQREQLIRELGMDKPIWEQYGTWISGVITRGDLGTRLWEKDSVTNEILRRLPVTFELGAMALLTGLLISFPIGIYSGIRQDTVGDYIGRSIAIFCVAVPGFWIATMVVTLPSIWWNWSPPIRIIDFVDNPIENLGQFIIPGVIVGMGMAGANMRMVRTMMLEVLRQDYIRTAWSKGLRERVVVVRHALKNAMIPVITVIGLNVPILIGGTVIIEQIFTLPGIGRLVVSAAFNRDYPALSGTVFFIAAGVMFINLLVDLTYAWLDPRVHYR